jgi:hypothetical protein
MALISLGKNSLTGPSPQTDVRSLAEQFPVDREAVMKELIIIFGLVALGFIGSLATSWQTGMRMNWKAISADTPSKSELHHPQSLTVADAPPPDDRGTPGQRV